MWRFIIVSFLIWRIAIFGFSWWGRMFIPQRIGFLGPSVWANFDGIHYLSIAQNGYMGFEEAFFPLYPFLTRFLAKTVFGGNYLWAGLFISHLSFFVALIIFYKLVKLEFDEKIAKVATLGLLIFPTSFFFGAIYTEALFLMLILASFYYARKEKWFLAGLFGGLASATKLIGIFLLPALLWQWWRNKKDKGNLLWLILVPFGVSTYMWYLNGFVGDSLAFIHAQPAFGAHRTGGQIVLLPQVYWRYLKIFLTSPLTNYDFWIALLEFFIFNLMLLSLWWAWERKIKSSYLIFSFLALVGPTLTGTFSSVPRYTVVLFPIFVGYGLIKNRGIKISLFLLSLFLLIILTILFTRGFFVA